MRPSVDVRTPISTGDAHRVGPRRWRKQVLPVGTFKIGERTLNVTADYCTQVADAFAAGAYDTAPVMLADKTNDHTMALLDAGGEVLALDTEPDGLYATVQLSAPAEEQIIRNRRCGVSVRIRENYARADGKFYPAAMQHLLLTWDPRLPNLKPWSQIDLSNTDGVAVVDLSNLSYPSTTPTEGEPTMAGLTDAELATLRAALPLLAKLPGGPDGLDQGATGETADTTALPGKPAAGAAPAGEDDDAEFERIAAEIFGDLDDEDGDSSDEGEGEGGNDDDDAEGEGEGEDGGEGDGEGEPADVADRELVSASNTDADYLDLTGRDADRDRILELSTRLDVAEYEKERDQLVRATGIPPSIIDLAQPLLQGSGNVVELSNGAGTADAGDIIRKMLTAIGNKIQLLDLSAALGTDEPDDEAVAEAENRGKVADQILANLN